MAQVDQVHDNPEERRFELEVDGETAFTAYQKRGDTIIFTHTEVPSDERGEGVGNTVSRGRVAAGPR